MKNSLYLDLNSILSSAQTLLRAIVLKLFLEGEAEFRGLGSPLPSLHHLNMCILYYVPTSAHIKCVAINGIYMVELQDRVLAPWGPSSISAVAELVLFFKPYRSYILGWSENCTNLFFLAVCQQGHKV